MGVRPLGGGTARRGDRLVDLGAPGARHEDAVRAVLQDQSHRGIAMVEQRAAGVGAQPLGEGRLRGADAAIDLQHTEPEIEQHGRAVLAAQRLRVRPELGEHRAAAHRALALRQAEGYALAPALRGDRLERDRLQSGQRLQPDAAARRHHRSGRVLTHQLRRLARIAHEFRDGAERAEAPLRLRIGKLVSNQFERTCHFLPCDSPVRS